jgi:magnesium chelatase accessory protein
MTDNASSDRLSWERDGRDWPNREASRFIDAGGLRMHVQQMGSGPVALLVHGTGASTHSWRDFSLALSKRFTVIAPDLPGHGFTGSAPVALLSLPGMATAVARLMAAMHMAPVLVVGHSAGAAVMARMAIDQTIAPRALVSLNGALLPLRGVAGKVFSPLAKLAVQSTAVSRLFSWRAGQPGVMERLLADTGSKIDRRGIDLYARLARTQGHVAGTLQMMANWELEGLARDLPRLGVPLLLVVGSDDRTISSEDAFKVRDLVPGSRVEYLRGLGHLAHEEQPAEVAAAVGRFYDAIAGGRR